MSAWLTEWERKGPKWEKARARVLSTMEGIAAQPNGFVQGSGLYDFDTGEAEQKARYGSDFGGLLLFQGHSRLDAYAAVQTGDAATKFYGPDGCTESSPWKTEKPTGPVTPVAGSEAA
ncbi:hypothetical protein ABZV75_20335 [Streptomyces flaveolus]|uniref:exo-rhamnogalacturonan lyase family protein n=1 Tax=Streptomyces flaveolus TaxID=67297 RepID=UPI0033A6BA6E